MMTAHGGADGGRSHEGAMKEGWPPSPGGRPTAAEQVVEEPETESQ